MNGSLGFSGICSVYKPSGITSAGVVEKIKLNLASQLQLKPQKLKVGHGGTLDKAAEGVLVIGVGSGCKKLTHYLHCNKVYVATGVLGTATDTLDGNGTVVDEKSFDVSENVFMETLKSFKGQYLQVPPLYSAMKFDGVRASDWARKGIPMDMKSKQRTIIIYHIALCKNLCLPVFEIIVSCSSGTYIRCLIRDIGEKLGTVAYMRHLCRIKQGCYGLNKALRCNEWTLERIKKNCGDHMHSVTV